MTPADPTTGPTGATGAGKTGTGATGTGPTSSSMGAAGRSGTDAARDAARGAAEDARQGASRVADRAREGVREGVASAQEEANRRVNRSFERAADEVSRTSQALESAADEFDEGSIQHQLLHRAAGGLHDVSDRIRGRTIGELASGLADFGRRNPAAFIGGAALIGFAVSRFARASRSSRSAYGDAAYGRGGYEPSSRSYGAGTMPQPHQPATTHTPYGAAGGSASMGTASTGTASTGTASTGSVTGGTTAPRPVTSSVNRTRLGGRQDHAWRRERDGRYRLEPDQQGEAECLMHAPTMTSTG